MESIHIDVRGMECPIPLMQLKEALASAASGQVIEVSFTCPEATTNLPDYCQDNGIEILDYKREGNQYWQITVRKP